MTLALAAAGRDLRAGRRPRAHDRLIAVIPPEIGVPPLGPSGLLPYRCSVGPVYNFYHDALYSQAPAVHGGYAYRPYYRYTANRVVPRTHKCGELR